MSSLGAIRTSLARSCCTPRVLSELCAADLLLLLLLLQPVAVIGEKLGAGNYGAVYRGMFQGKAVAIKQLIIDGTSCGL